MKLIIGLQNPGLKYAATRHNAGSLVLRALFPDAVWQSKFQGKVAKLKHAGTDCLLLLPETYMNNSGQAAQAAASFYKIPPEDIIVLHDELDLPSGEFKAKQGGGHAGHNGLKSLDAHLGSKNYHRIRLGIGHPGHKDLVSDYVLHDFAKTDIEKLAEVVGEVSTALEKILAN